MSKVSWIVVSAVCGLLATAGQAGADPGNAQRFTVVGSAFEPTAKVAAADEPPGKPVGPARCR